MHWGQGSEPVRTGLRVRRCMGWASVSCSMMYRLPGSGSGGGVSWLGASGLGWSCSDPVPHCSRFRASWSWPWSTREHSHAEQKLSAWRLRTGWGALKRARRAVSNPPRLVSGRPRVPTQLQQRVRAGAIHTFSSSGRRLLVTDRPRKKGKGGKKQQRTCQNTCAHNVRVVQ